MTLTSIWKAYLQLLSKCMLQLYKQASLIILLLPCQLYFSRIHGTWCKDTYRGLLLWCIDGQIWQLQVAAWGAFAKANLSEASVTSISFLESVEEDALNEESLTFTGQLRCNRVSFALPCGYGGHSGSSTYQATLCFCNLSLLADTPVHHGYEFWHHCQLN